MTLTAPTGVLSLRDALRRARKAGADVSNPNRTGEVRVTAPGHHPITINARRKDETAELHKLIVDLEAAMPAQLAQPAPPLPPTKPGSVRDRVVSWLDAQPSSPDGWVTYPGSGKVAEQIGLRGVDVAVTVNVLEKQGYAELRRTAAAGGPKGARVTGVRLTGVLKPQRPIAASRPRPQPVPDYRDQPLRSAPAPERLGPIVGVPDTPKLADYAAARKLASGQPMLRAAPSDSDLAEILSEAVRLYWWLRAERNGQR